MTPKLDHSVYHLRRRLRDLATPESREAQGRFFKEPVRSLGVRTPDLRKLAVIIAARFTRRLDRRHWTYFEGWSKTLSNWGETDALCAEILSPLLAHEPRLVKNLKEWTDSESRWQRRAAAVSLVKSARRGEMHTAAFDICDRLIGDRDDMVQKAVGWLLKEISRTEPRAVLEYLLEHRDRMSRLTLRYAAEKLPDHMRRRLFPS